MNKDKLSISDKAFDKSLSYGENLRRIREAGFTHLHFAHAFMRREPLSEEECEEIEQGLEAHGIKVLDGHGCHPLGINTWSPAEEDREEAILLLRHRLDLTKRFGGDSLVYHVPWQLQITDQIVAFFIEGLKRVEEYARERGLGIALENHYTLEGDRRALEAAFSTFDSRYIGFTFDPGHALISGNTEWLLQNCAERLMILHLNDNDTEMDLHWCPYEEYGSADWPQIEDFVRRSPYQKPIQLEVQWRPDKHVNHMDFLREAKAAGDRFREECNPVP